MAKANTPGLMEDLMKETMSMTSSTDKALIYSETERSTQGDGAMGSSTGLERLQFRRANPEEENGMMGSELDGLTLHRLLLIKT